MRFSSLDTVVRDTCSLMGDENAENYIRVARSARLVLEELHLLAIPYLKSDWYTISDNYTIALPDDCVQVMRVATLDHLNRVHILGEDPRLRRVKATEYEAPIACDNPDLEVQNTPSGTAYQTVTFYNLNARGNYVGELYGKRERAFTDGVYRWDKQTNILELGSGSEICAGAQLLVEYKSDFGEDMHRLVPQEWSIAISYRIMQLLSAWKDPGKSESLFRNFLRNYQTIKRQSQFMDIKQWTSAIDESRYGAPKW